ncbi:hypothetical protein DL93DRAFT_2070010 [Clavulina sp. PMI_390]|nr:hypothetical protein DL93DRAFT_2070010 [Clavulina sp. PMI_390]
MPFIRVSTPKDSFNIYYRTNASSSTTNCAFRPDSERPTILLVAPASFSIDFLNHQFDDPALQRYNLVAFDPPGYGKSECANLKNREQACMIDDWAMAA